MPAWLIPLLIQVGEALLYGIAAGVASYQAGTGTNAALIAGFTTFIGKVSPSQIFGAKPPAPPA